MLVIGFVAACSGHASLFLNPSEDLGDAIQPVDTKKPSDPKQQSNQRPNTIPQQNNDQQFQTAQQQQNIGSQQQAISQPQFIPQKSNGYNPTIQAAANQPFANGYQPVPSNAEKFIPPPVSAQADQKLQDMIAVMVAQQVVAYESLKKNSGTSPPFETGLSSDVGTPPQVPTVYAAAIAAAAAAAAVQVMTYTSLPPIRSSATKPYFYSPKSYSPVHLDHNGILQQYQQYLSNSNRGGIPVNGANTPFNS